MNKPTDKLNGTFNGNPVSDFAVAKQLIKKALSKIEDPDTLLGDFEALTKAADILDPTKIDVEDAYKYNHRSLAASMQLISDNHETVRMLETMTDNLIHLGYADEALAYMKAAYRESDNAELVGVYSKQIDKIQQYKFPDMFYNTAIQENTSE